MMVRSTLLAFCAIVAAVGAGHAAAAQRHFVASNGNDANPCSISAPCRSFAAAALLVDPNGEIIVQDTAGYGFVNVTKPLSILSPYGVYAGISVFAGNNGVTINAPGGSVRLTGVYINGQGGSIGINVLNATGVTVEGSSVTNMASHGFSATSASARIVIRNTVFRDNGGMGVTITGALQTTIDAIHAERNALGGISLVGTNGTMSRSVSNDNGGNGVFVSAPSLATTTIAIEDHASSNNNGHGITAQVFSAAAVYVTVARSAMSGNTQHGALAMTSGQGTARITLSYSELMANGTSGATADTGSALIIVHGATITQNPIGVQGLSFALVRSAGNNSITNNTTDLGANYATYAQN
jgi:Right handed beta helix region